ncbi:MAG: hypothetical protein L6R36_006708 [Xanthoria steineri]|nr:MAG: hypothetical protein L6R36_006708 [Xanthoria steineri]
MQRAFDRARQLVQETRGDRRTRNHQGFPSTERTLPALGSPSSIPITQNISSYLGKNNPFAGPVDPKTESVWLFDNTAYRPIHPYPHSPQPWQASFSAAFFKTETGRDVSKVVADIADKIGLKETGTEEDRERGEQTIAKRLQPFVDVIAPAKWVDVKLPNGKVQRLGPGGRSATSQQTITFATDYSNAQTIETDAMDAALTPIGPMSTTFAEPEGWLVISDIDDTVKVTLTPSPVGILRTTFLSDPEVIASMPALYNHIQSLLNPTWFYLSASPYNLYPFLRSFLHANYPKGTILLRDASWMDLSGFLLSLTMGTEAYKTGEMDKIHGWLPKRKVLCVGDSTQSDPEAYGNVYRRYNGWVKKIFIRKVAEVAEMNKEEKNSPERFEKAFKDVPKDVWQVFEDPNELYAAVDALKAT